MCKNNFSDIKLLQAVNDYYRSNKELFSVTNITATTLGIIIGRKLYDTLRYYDQKYDPSVKEKTNKTATSIIPTLREGITLLGVLGLMHYLKGTALEKVILSAVGIGITYQVSKILINYKRSKKNQSKTIKQS